MSDWTKDYARRAEILQKELAGTSRDDVENATDWRDRLNVVRRIYRAYGALASEGLHDWMRRPLRNCGMESRDDADRKGNVV